MPPTLEEYEAFIYSLPTRYPLIQHAVLSFIRLGPLTAMVRAELFFACEVVLRVRQTLDFAEGFIQSYSYEVYQGEEKRYWYDSWPHPHIAELAATDPHHKHVPPDLKHHRIPAPDLSFARPNLPFLIAEIAQTLSSES
jgi:Family of unknown function (DUF6516)